MSNLLAVIITSVFKEENFVSARMSSREVANTGLPKLLLDDLKYYFDMRACSYYITTVTATKECSVNPFISSTCMT